MADIPDGGRVSRRSLLLGTAGAVIVIAAGAGGFDYELGRHPGLRRDLFGCGATPAIPTSDYAITTGSFASAAMHTDVPWAFAMPGKRTHPPGPTSLVIALPGMGGHAQDMVTDIGLPGWATAAGLNIAFASPGAVGSTYYHPRADGTNALQMVTEEFIPLIEQRFGVGGSRDRRAMFGWSMGGFGALLVAAHRPDLVCATVGSSPAVFPSYDAAITGHANTFDSDSDWERWGLWDHLRALDGMPVRIDCGDADPFAATARALLNRIPDAVGQISSGCHTTGFWRRNATTQLRFLAGHLA